MELKEILEPHDFYDHMRNGETPTTMASQSRSDT